MSDLPGPLNRRAVRTNLSKCRTQGRHLAAEVYGAEKAALHRSGDPACSDKSLATLYGLKSHHTVGDWGKPDSGVAITLGDLAGGHRVLAVNTLRSLADRLENGAPARKCTNPTDEVMAALSRLGELADTARLAVHAHSPGAESVTSGEWEDLEAKATAMEREVRTIKLAFRAAKERAR
jgi:hypothetical protein